MMREEIPNGRASMSKITNGKFTLLTMMFCNYIVYIAKAATVDNDVLPTTATNHIIDSDLSSISFNATICSRCLKKLNVRPLVHGPDYVPPVILNNCCNNLAYPIAYIFQLCFDNLFLPDVWRQAYTPVFKKGDATQVAYVIIRLGL